jgi:hypothetical protein
LHERYVLKAPQDIPKIGLETIYISGNRDSFEGVLSMRNISRMTKRRTTMKLAKAIQAGLDIALLGAMVWSLTILTGCGSAGGTANGGGGGTATGALASGGASTFYAVQGQSEGPNVGVKILLFKTTDGSGAVPTATLLPPAEMLVDSVTTDSKGQIYVAGALPDGFDEGVLVYAAGATGAATPVRTIDLGADSEETITATAMTVDTSGQIYLTGYTGNVAVISATANGTTTPTRLITLEGSNAGLGIAVDSKGNTYVAYQDQSGSSEAGAIEVFGPSATGSATPIQQISSEDVLFGVALDASGNIYSVADTATASSSGAVSTTAKIVEYAADASGAATPMKTISGSSTGLTFGYSPAIDSVGNLYLINLVYSGTEDDLTYTASALGFGPNASGNVAPGMDVSSSSLTYPGNQLALN